MDYASSENANNVVLVEIYERVCREMGWLIPPQEENTHVRQGIAGRPIAMFWQNTNTGTVTFVGKGNFNNDKSTADVFGFSDGAESWEFLKNFLPYVEFKANDFSSKSLWEDQLECRYPNKKYTNTTKLKRVFDFVVAHNWEDATVKSNFNNDKSAMLADFKAHFDEYFDKDLTLFYYLFTAQFIMMDSRAKNMFLTTYDGIHWLPLPYDFDTALGINNEGVLAYKYSLEDTDLVEGNVVFNGQNSVLWNNIREAFQDELDTRYRNLRNQSDTFNYRAVRNRFKSHQSVWPERLWNEDEWRKYVTPSVTLLEEAMAITDPEERAEAIAQAQETVAEYFSMLQGDKDSQRDKFVYGSYRYNDAKHRSGDAVSSNNTISFRAYGQPVGGNPLTISVKPYMDIYTHIRYASADIDAKTAFNDVHRTMAGETYVSELQYSQGTNDTEIAIHSGDLLSEIGDLSPLKIGSANFRAARKLQQLIIGSSASGYTNPWLTSLELGNNELLTLLNVCNCPNLNSSIDLSGCISLETVLATGSGLRAVSLPAGGKLERLDLPNTLTTLEIKNQRFFTTLNVVNSSGTTDYSNISRLNIENTPNVPIEAILMNMVGDEDTHGNVRLYNVEWNATSEANLTACLDKLDTSRGIDESGNPMTEVGTAVVSGRVNLSSSISASLIERIQNDYPNLVVVVNGKALYIMSYLNYDNAVLYREAIEEGSDATNPVTAGKISAPTRPATTDSYGDLVRYAFVDFGTLPTAVTENKSMVAQYNETYRVRYLGDSGSTTDLQTSYVANNGTIQYNGSMPTKTQTDQYTYTFKQWQGSAETGYDASVQASDFSSTGALTVHGPYTVTATYTSTTRTYTATFKNDDNTTVLGTQSNVPYGTTPSYSGTTPTSTQADMGAFQGWTPALGPITGNTTYTATYQSPVEVAEITDDWATIIDNIENGLAQPKYKLGNYKPLDLGTEGTVNMQIVAIDTDVDSAGSTIPVTMIAKELLANTRKYNTNYSGRLNVWSNSNIRNDYLNGTLLTKIDAALASHIAKAKKVTHTSSINNATSYDKIWLPSLREVNGESNTQYSEGSIIYTRLFPNQDSRVKCIQNGSNPTEWWLRSNTATGNAAYCDTRGYVYINNTKSMYNDSLGVCIGFCLAPDTIHDSWDKISDHITAGDYATVYSIGDTKAVDIGDQGNICFQIAAFDADTDEDGHTIPITWVAKQMLVTKKPMNSSSTNVGGYPSSAMKTYVDALESRMPATLKSMIKAAVKTSFDYNGGTTQDLSTAMRLWIPSNREVFGGTTYEKTGPIYSTLFPDAASRIKKIYGGTADRWWLRSDHYDSAVGFHYVGSNGSSSGSGADNTLGVVLGFCTGAKSTT